MVTIKNGHNLRQNGVASGKRGEGLDFLNIPDGGGKDFFSLLILGNLEFLRLRKWGNRQFFPAKMLIFYLIHYTMA